jgi:ubiquinone/menaquinone biosynthesis C-methylase UbiE
VTTQRSFEAGQRFILAAKKWWTSDLYQRLRSEYETRAGASAARHVVSDVAEALEDLAQYRYFAWLERHLQRMKYSGAYGLARYYDQEREKVLPALDAAGHSDAPLELRPDLPLPRYYTDVDIHQHPGGVWSDEVAGIVYEHGARSTTPMLGSSHADLHTRFTSLVAAQGAPAKILDMGCGFGKSTAPFYATFPGAQVEGIDLAAPCLRLAAAVAQAAGATNIHFRQRDAADTRFPAGSFDLVTSTMLLHEIPPVPLDAVLAEAIRVLEPGGRMVHLDFHWFPDAFARFMHYGHGRRNNEPYMQPLAEIDLHKLLRRHGFEDINVEPFREADDLGPERKDLWRLPWTVISARRPLAARRALTAKRSKQARTTRSSRRR